MFHWCRTAILSVPLIASASTAFAADPFPYGDRHTFGIYRDGNHIGQHSLTFRHEGSTLVVDAAVDLRVTFAGLTLFRYTHRSQERWQDGEQLIGLTSETNQNGDRYRVFARSLGSALAVQAAVPETRDLFGSESRASPVRLKEIRVPADTPSSSHWNRRQVETGTLLNSQTGEINEYRIDVVGREKVQTAAGPVEATLYRYSGDLHMDHWFDDRGRWVRLRFEVPDGSIIDYRLE
jgi:hypothetical protein